MVSIVVYVPDSHLENVKKAMFAAGAGRMGNYDSCCWQTKGEGQFRPLDQSNPRLGKKGVLEKVVEWKLELVCERQFVEEVILALKKKSPL